jgi:hypothetical protein
MNPLLNAFWRAAAYCLHPRVIALSFLPLLVMVALGWGLWYFFWEPAVLAVRTWLDNATLLAWLWNWLAGIGATGVKAVLPPLLIVVLLTPAVVVVSLMTVALLMTPALVSLVAQRRFNDLERKKGGSLLASVAWSAGSVVVAVLALIVSIPLWFVPPLVLILPPLIWGWLAYRVMTFDALAEHASSPERKELFRRHRGHLLIIGVLTGYLGAAPAIVWASGVVFVTLFAVLIPVAIWIYTLVFAFSSLWFSHYCLTALDTLRREQALEAGRVAKQVAAQAEAETALAMHATHETQAPTTVTAPATPATIETPSGDKPGH